MRVFKLLLCSSCCCGWFGCVPVNLDATFTWGSNQSVKKTLEINQVQTDAQVAAGGQTVSEVVSGVVATVPLLLREVPSPTPTPAPAAKMYELVIPTPCPTVGGVRKVPLRAARITVPCPTATPTPLTNLYR